MSMPRAPAWFRLRTWVRVRAGLGPLPSTHVSRQRALALYLSVFAAVRTALWLGCMGVIMVHWLGGGDAFIDGFIRTSSTVLFVTFISFYCNASTDAANLTAGIAALYAADTGGTLASEFDVTQADIARLADLEPGQEAAELAMTIRARLLREKKKAGDG